jgi:hypothetical protein
VEPGLLDALQPGDRLLLTGHSLGAPVVGLLGNALRLAYAEVEPAVLFAVPNFADAAYLASVVLPTFTINLPGDPVPYLPPNVVFLMGNSPASIRWDAVYRRFSGGLPLLTWGEAAHYARDLDWWVILAAASQDPNENPHQTYQYLTALWTGLGQQLSSEASALVLLLKSLGLFAPWPSLAEGPVPLLLADRLP